MLNSILSSTTSIPIFAVCLLTSIFLGGALALLHAKFNRSSKGFLITIALMPAMVQIIILLVNGNLGTGVAVMGAFSLVRFRSIPGTAKEISSIFMAMAIGLATGTGYIGIAFLFSLILGFMMFLYNSTSFGEPKEVEKELNITISENVDYEKDFRDLFEKYTKRWELIRVKTSNMGSLYKLQYQIILKTQNTEKTFMDELRCRNGNLEIICGRVNNTNEEL